MRSKAAPRETKGQLRSNQQQDHGERERDRAEPVQRSRREFFPALRVGILVSQQVKTFTQEIAPPAAARGAAEQRLHRKMGSHARAAVR